MTQLTKTQKYAIEYLVGAGKTDTEIAKELKIDLDSVIKYMEKSAKARTSKSNLPVKQSNITSKDLMVRKTSNKGNNTVAIMTKDAAMYNDDFKKNVSENEINTQHIHKIK